MCGCVCGCVSGRPLRGFFGIIFLDLELPVHESFSHGVGRVQRRYISLLVEG